MSQFLYNFLCLTYVAHLSTVNALKDQPWPTLPLLQYTDRMVGELTFSSALPRPLPVRYKNQPCRYTRT